jgi:hypothetical protein
MKVKSHVILAGSVAFLLAVCAFSLFLLAGIFGSLVGMVDTEVSRLTLLGCLTFLLSSLIVARSLSRRVQALESGTPAKEALYQRVLAVWMDAHRRGNAPAGAEFEEIERLLVLRAGRGMLKCYLELCRTGRSLDSSHADVTRTALEKLIFEMRKDLGHRDLPWSSAAAADLLLRHREPSANAVPGSGQFRVVEGRKL